MEIRKDETERAINLLKFYKSQLTKSEEKSLRKAMDKLVETLEAPLFSALLDIQEFYEVSLSTAIDGNQPKSPTKIDESHSEIQYAIPPEAPVKVKKERSKKSKRRQKSEEDESDEMDNVQRSPQENVATKNIPELASPKQSNQYHQESKPAHRPEQYEEPEENLDDEQNPWLYFEIELNKGRKGYGFAVAGGYNKPHYEGDNGIFVTKIIPEGAAEVDGRLKIDDVIVSVNEVNLEYVTHETAVETLKTAGQNMTLIIRRLKDEYFESEAANLEAVAPEPVNAAYYAQEPETYEEENSNFQQFEITLTKRSGGGLGISIQGGYDPSNHEEDSYISISKLTPNGVADTDGRLQVGDIILHVDDQSLNGVTHEEAVNLLKNTGKTVTLYIGRFVEVLENVEQEPEEPIVEKTEKKKKKKHRRDREE